MKKGIRKVFILFLGSLALVVLTITLNAAAETGHGGKTKVIARISPPQTSQSSVSSDESSDESNSYEESQTQESSSTENPAGTGDSFPLILFFTSAVSLAMIMVSACFLSEKKKTRGENFKLIKTDNHKRTTYSFSGK